MPRINKLEAEKARSSWNLQTRKVERVLSLATHLSLSFCLMRLLFSTSGQLCNARWRCGAKGQRGRENKKNEKWHLSQAWFPRLLSEKSVTSDTRTRRHHWVIVPNIPVSIRLKAKLPEGMALACCPQPFLSAISLASHLQGAHYCQSEISHKSPSLVAPKSQEAPHHVPLTLPKGLCPVLILFGSHQLLPWCVWRRQGGWAELSRPVPHHRQKGFGSLNCLPLIVADC